jgi:metal-sulfur cluster biosynthetic enzyme
MNVVKNITESEARALAALQEVPDPETGLNVVDMGLIYELTVEEEAKKIFVLMTLSTQFCPMGHSIVDAVTIKLQVTFSECDVQVLVTFDPPWRPEMISENGRLFLNS